MPHLMLKDLPRYECLLEAAREFPDMDPSACEVFLNLLRTADDVFDVIEANFSNHRLSQGRFGVLMLLWRPAAKSGSDGDCACNAPRTPADLADAAGVTRATMTGLIDTLERDGLVKRGVDPADRRMQQVSLTPKGNEVLRAMLPSHFQIMSSVMASLKENERDALVKLLTKISSQVSRQKAETADSRAGADAPTRAGQ
jgi:DNA-binding MarR family transcriptional regulator